MTPGTVELSDTALYISPGSRAFCAQARTKLGRICDLQSKIKDIFWRK